MTRRQVAVIAEEQVPAALAEAELAGWVLENGWIRRKYVTDGWATTLMLVNAIGYICEAADHHADLAVSYAKVWVKLQTHSAGGVTALDVELARRIEDHVLWRPGPGSSLDGTPSKFVQGG